jgi:hypothetical protein
MRSNAVENVKKHPRDPRQRLMGLLLTVVMLAVWAGCTRSEDESKVQPPKPQIQKNNAIKIASRQAKQLGYDPDKMTVECEKPANEFVVVFLPPTSQVGGDLTIKIDAATGEVTGILRGQ